MGQVLIRKRLHESSQEFTDLDKLPPEVAIGILSHLNATDLCLAGCVWQHLANDQILWKGVCRSEFGFSPTGDLKASEYKRIFLQLDEATLTFNANPENGINYLLRYGLIENVPSQIAEFLYRNRKIHWRRRRDYLQKRPDVLQEIIGLENFKNLFLPNALRKFFAKNRPTNDRGEYLHLLIDAFSKRFSTCNPNLNINPEAIYVICFSLILLSVDLSSPHIRNKMSKREFIKNTKRAASIDEEFCGHLYDNIYLVGHVAPTDL